MLSGLHASCLLVELQQLQPQGAAGLGLIYIHRGESHTIAQHHNSSVEARGLHMWSISSSHAVWSSVQHHLAVPGYRPALVLELCTTATLHMEARGRGASN